MFVLAASMILAACGGSSEEAITTDSVEVAADTTVLQDSVVVETPADSVLGTGTGGDIPAVK